MQAEQALRYKNKNGMERCMAFLRITLLDPPPRPFFPTPPVQRPWA